MILAESVDLSTVWERVDPGRRRARCHLRNHGPVPALIASAPHPGPVTLDLAPVAPGELPAGWHDGTATNPAMVPIGKDGTAVAVIDPYANAGIPGNLPGVGFAYTEWATPDGFEITIGWSGIFPVEATALAYVTTSGAGLDWTGVGGWPVHDFGGAGPAILPGLISGPNDSGAGHPNTFAGVDVCLFAHTDGTPRLIRYRFSLGRMAVAMETPPGSGIFVDLVGAVNGATSWAVPPQLLASTWHGIAIDTHYCTPDYPPHPSIDPVPPPTSPAILSADLVTTTDHTYRLPPGATVRLDGTEPVYARTESGSTTLGLIAGGNL